MQLERGAYLAPYSVRTDVICGISGWGVKLTKHTDPFNAEVKIR
jgi:hypothetical protein